MNTPITALWIALVPFATPEQCDAFNEAFGLQAYIEPQCTLVEDTSLAPSASIRPKPRPSLAPTTSPRPMPRPELE